MPEARYGRLFTEDDVLQIVNEFGYVDADSLRHAVESIDMRGGYSEAVGKLRRLTFPADEPLFLLRGQDAYAPSAVGDYLHRLNTPLEHRLAVEQAYDAMLEWQGENPNRVKVPDV